MLLKKLSFLVFLPLLFLSQLLAGFEKDLNLLAIKVSREVVRQEKKSIAVIDFTSEDGKMMQAGVFLADELASVFVKKGKKYESADSGFVVFDRKLTQNYPVIEKGAFNIPALKKLREDGKLDALIAGALDLSQGYPLLTLRLIDLKNGKVVATFSQKLTLTAPLKKLIDADQAGAKEETSSTSSTSVSSPTQEKDLVDQLETEETAAKASPLVISFNDFKLELVKVTRQEFDVLIEVKVTSEKELPVKVSFFPKETRLIGDDGNTYSPPFISFSGKDERNWGYAGGEAVHPKIAMPLKLKFQKVAKAVNVIKVLEISITVEGSKNGVAIFRDIPVR